MPQHMQTIEDRVSKLEKENKKLLERINFLETIVNVVVNSPIFKNRINVTEILKKTEKTNKIKSKEVIHEVK